MDRTQKKKKQQLKTAMPLATKKSPSKLNNTVHHFDIGSVFQDISHKSHQSLNDLLKAIDKVNIDPAPKPKIRVNVNMSNTNQSQSQYPKKELPAVKSTKQKLAELQKYRQKSLSRNKQKLNKHQKQENEVEQSKKLERIKQINKRKQELIDKLKKLDAELVENKKDHSPESLSRMDQMLLESKINKSYIRNMTNSKLNHYLENKSVVEQHSKAVSLIERLNNEKLKKQQKIAEEFRRKQQSEIKQLQEMERRKNQEIQKRRIKGEKEIASYLNRSKYRKQRNASQHQNKTSKISNIKVNSIHDNQMYANQFDEPEEKQNKSNDLMPMTMVTQKKNDIHSPDLDEDRFFNEEGNLISKKHLLTQRNQIDQTGEEFKEYRTPNNQADSIVPEQENDALISQEVKKYEEEIEQQIIEQVAGND